MHLMFWAISLTWGLKSACAWGTHGLPLNTSRHVRDPSIVNGFAHGQGPCHLCSSA